MCCWGCLETAIQQTSQETGRAWKRVTTQRERRLRGRRKESKAARRQVDGMTGERQGGRRPDQRRDHAGLAHVAPGAEFRALGRGCVGMTAAAFHAVMQTAAAHRAVADRLNCCSGSCAGQRRTDGAAGGNLRRAEQRGQTPKRRQKTAKETKAPVLTAEPHGDNSMPYLGLKLVTRPAYQSTVANVRQAPAGNGFSKFRQSVRQPACHTDVPCQ